MKGEARNDERPFGGKECSRCSHYRRIERPRLACYDDDGSPMLVTGKCALGLMTWLNDGADCATCSFWTPRVHLRLVRRGGA
jgi:hypothetical protein